VSLSLDHWCLRAKGGVPCGLPICSSRHSHGARYKQVFRMLGVGRRSLVRKSDVRRFWAAILLLGYTALASRCRSQPASRGSVQQAENFKSKPLNLIRSGQGRPIARAGRFVPSGALTISSCYTQYTYHTARNPFNAQFNLDLKRLLFIAVIESP
jgi:hypothetical protein